MFCPYCGHEVPEDAGFCTKCGKGLNFEKPIPVEPAPIQPVSVQPVPVQTEAAELTVYNDLDDAEKKKKQEEAKSAMVLAIVGASLAALGLPGLIISIIARKRVKNWIQKYGKLEGMAIPARWISLGGFILGIFMTVFWTLYFLAIILFFVLLYNEYNPYPYMDTYLL